MTLAQTTTTTIILNTNTHTNMTSAKKAVTLVLIITTVSLISIPQCSGSCLLHNDDSDGDIMGMFVFGSSLVDNGNNNFMGNSMAKANYLPYGIDFPQGPSGRFTNGKNVVDLIALKLGLPSLTPPFADPSTAGPRIVAGVNFASGASGILDDTGFIAVS